MCVWGGGEGVLRLSAQQEVKINLDGKREVSRWPAPRRWGAVKAPHTPVWNSLPGTGQTGRERVEGWWLVGGVEGWRLHVKNGMRKRHVDFL